MVVKKIVFLVGLGLLFLVGLFFLVWQRQPKGELLNPTVEEEEEAASLKTWQDPAGFSFNYPDALEIDNHPEDTTNYAHLELTATGQTGKVVVWVKETEFATISDWLVEVSDENSQVFDTELAGEPAKKLALTDKLMVAAIDIDALVLLELYPDQNNFWQPVFDQILSSFALVPLEGEPGYQEVNTAAPGAWQSGGSGGVILEEEEVIE